MSAQNVAEGLDFPARADNRLLSLDAFRGLTIIAMILVNTPGSWDHVYAPLLHAKWHGVTPTDYIFPFFIFIVGVSIVLSYKKMQAKGAGKGKLVGKTFKRATIIFAIGIFLGLFLISIFRRSVFRGCCSGLRLFSWPVRSCIYIQTDGSRR